MFGDEKIFQIGRSKEIRLLDKILNYIKEERLTQELDFGADWEAVGYDTLKNFLNELKKELGVFKW